MGLWDMVGQWAEIPAPDSLSLLRVDVQSTEQWLGGFSLQQILSTKLLIVVPLGFLSMGNKPLKEGPRGLFPSGWLLELGVNPAAGCYGVDVGREIALFGEDGRQALLSFWVACLLWVPCTPTTSPIYLHVRLHRDAVYQLSCLLCLQARCREYRLGPLLVAVNL